MGNCRPDCECKTGGIVERTPPLHAAAPALYRYRWYRDREMWLIISVTLSALATIVFTTVAVFKSI